MAEPTEQDLSGLLDLADSDAAIRRLNAKLADLPQQQRLDELEGKAQLLGQRHADVRLERDAAAAVAARHDRDVTQLRERLAAEQQRMYGGEITNARELSKLEAEIQSVRDRIDDHEASEFEAMEQMEELEVSLADVATQSEVLEISRAQAQRERDDASSELVAAITECEVVREGQRDQLLPQLLEVYDEAIERHRGSAVGRLDEDRCTACGISLSRVDVNALFEGPPLTTCPSCQRPLVVI